MKIKLFNYGSNELNALLIKEFERFCKKNKLSCKKANYSNELNIYRIDNVTEDGFDELKSFDGIQLITEMPRFNITLDEFIEENDVPDILMPKEGFNYPTIGVLDTGIANIPHLAPWILNENVSYYHDDDINKAHGTFVSGVLLYGDYLEGKPYTGLGGCKLFEAIVMPDLNKQSISENELIEQIRDAIKRNSHIKIWNLSLGTDKEADLYKFSDFAIALDDIQEIYDVLICKSAGNCKNFTINAPKSRISKSADTVRGLVVGAITQIKNDAVNVNNPALFSRKGPGPSYLIKPDVVHIGGNAALNDRNQLIVNPVKSFSLNGSIAKQVGTSFSTPRISAIAAGLNNMINEEFNQNLLKALIIHSAKYPPEMVMDISEKIDFTGFGLPSNINDILYNEPNEITLILQDSIERGSYVDILDFPYPKSMIDDEGNYYGEITVTLVTSPILDANQGSEYCQSNIDVMLGTYGEKIEKDLSNPKVKNPIGTDKRQNVLATSVYSRKEKSELETPFATERMLVSYGDKYQPVKNGVSDWMVLLEAIKRNI